MTNLSMPASRVQLANIGEPAGQCRGCRHRGTQEMRASIAALPAAEVAVAGRSAALVFGQPVAVECGAQRATGIVPFEPCRDEDAIEALRLRLPLDRARSR